MSNVDKGRLFRDRCQATLKKVLERDLEVEVSIQVPGRKPHKFDLATPERDVVVECKAFAWTETGNVPSAKIVHLREAVENLRVLGDGVTRYLVLDRAAHPKRRETLAQYFVRLNDEILGPVNVLELSSDARPSCLYGVPPSSLPARDPVVRYKPSAPGPAQAPPPSATIQDAGLSTVDLNALRTKLLRLLDWLEGRRGPADETLAARVSRLYFEGVIPRQVAALMHVVRELRNVAEYDGWKPTQNATIVVRYAWAEVSGWAEQQGWREQGVG